MHPLVVILLLASHTCSPVEFLLGPTGLCFFGLPPKGLETGFTGLLPQGTWFPWGAVCVHMWGTCPWSWGTMRTYGAMCPIDRRCGFGVPKPSAALSVLIAGIVHSLPELHYCEELGHYIGVLGLNLNLFTICYFVVAYHLNLLRSPTSQLGLS